MAQKPSVPTPTSELFAKVAEITSQWNVLELYLCNLLAAIMKVESATAMAILYSITAHRLRREIIMNAATTALADDADIRAIERILNRCARAVKKRNALSHGILATHSEHPGTLAVTFFNPDLDPAPVHYELFDQKSLTQIEKDFTKLTDDIGELAAALTTAKRRTWLGTQTR